MRRLYQAANSLEAQHLVDFLADHDVRAVISGAYLSGAAGELPLNIFPSVWLVHDGDWLRAGYLLDEFRQPAAAAQAWTCAQCGETVEGVFEVCWNCGNCRDAS